MGATARIVALAVGGALVCASAALAQPAEGPAPLVSFEKAVRFEDRHDVSKGLDQ